jgi:hypothetical protein
MVLQSMLAVHVIDHAADTPVERGCILCKFADNKIDIARSALQIVVPGSYVVEYEDWAVTPVFLAEHPSRSIRAPPLFS